MRDNLQSMRRVGILTAAIAAAALLVPGSASAGFGTMAVLDDEFEFPNEEAGIGGGVFSWAWDDSIQNEHSVRQDNKIFTSGPPTDNIDEVFGPMELPAGKYHYYCQVHGSKNGGMDGLIRITPSVDTPMGGETNLQWAFPDDGIRVGDRWDVRYRVNDGEWKPWLKNTKKIKGVFGANNEPVNYNPTKTYQVSAKTKLASDPDRRSAFSPPVAFGLE